MNTTLPMPNVPMAMLTSLPLTAEQWTSLALHASWQTTRMNLNTFERHGVFTSRTAVRTIADRLRSRHEILRAKAFPYQLLAAYIHAHNAPHEIREALHDALEIATENVPAFDGDVWILVDVSGSMRSPVTGERGGGTSAVECVQVAALIAATVLRRNPTARILSFSDTASPISLTARDSIMSNATRLASLPSGGTNCSAPIRWMNDHRERGDLVLLVSDYESWMDSRKGPGPTQTPTATLVEWEAFRQRNPTAKLVCLDLQPNPHTQAVDREDILNVGGFSDAVFTVIESFARRTPGERSGPQRWVDEIRAVVI